MNRFSNSRSYRRPALAVSACENREEGALPKVSPDAVKREAKEAVGAAVGCENRGSSAWPYCGH